MNPVKIEILTMTLEAKISIEISKFPDQSGTLFSSPIHHRRNHTVIIQMNADIKHF